MTDSPSQPKPPDPTKTSNAQLGYTKDMLQYLQGVNSQGVNSPFGSISYTQGPNGSQTQNIKLDPASQAILDKQRQTAFGLTSKAYDQLSGLPQGQFSLDSLGVHAPGTGDFADWGNKIAKNSYDRQIGLLQPGWDQQGKEIDQRLSDRGLPVGGEAYNTATGNFYNSQNQARDLAAQNALSDAGNEESRLFGLQSNAYDTALQSKLAERQQPFNELSAYLGAAPQQTYQQQNQLNPLSAPAPDYQGAVNTQYQGQLANYQAQLAQQNAMWGAVASLGGDAAKAYAASSREFKENIQPVDGKTLLDRFMTVPAYAYDYKASVGPMAEDFNAEFGGPDKQLIPMNPLLGIMWAAIQELTKEVRALRAKQ